MLKCLLINAQKLMTIIILAGVQMHRLRVPRHAPRRRRAAPAHHAPLLLLRPDGHLRRLGRRRAAPGLGRVGGGGRFETGPALAGLSVVAEVK